MGTPLHAAHGVIIAIGAIAVLSVLLPGHSRRQARRVARLREDAVAETLVQRAEQRAAAELAASPDGGTDARRAPSRWLVAAALTSVAAAVIHGAVGPEHFREALRLGLFFTFICVAELLLAGLLLRRPSLLVAALAATVNALTVALWAITRTVGLPFDLAEIEPVGVLDALASSVELVAVICSVAWIAQHRSALLPRRASIQVQHWSAG